MAEYFTNRVEEAYNEGKVFVVGDKVALRRRPMDEARFQGAIVMMAHGNYGKGRIWATVKFDDGFIQKFPLGSLKLI